MYVTCTWKRINIQTQILFSDPWRPPQWSFCTIYCVAGLCSWNMMRLLASGALYGCYLTVPSDFFFHLFPICLAALIPTCSTCVPGTPRSYSFSLQSNNHIPESICFLVFDVAVDQVTVLQRKASEVRFSQHVSLHAVLNYSRFWVLRKVGPAICGPLLAFALWAVEMLSCRAATAAMID